VSTLLGALGGAVAALRAAAYRRGWVASAKLRGPVISIGNLSAGGRGKTPLVAVVGRMLRDEGLPVAVLSRGYGGSNRAPALIVSDGTRALGDAGLAGDEPVMLARELHGVIVAVGARRDRVGRHVEDLFGPCVHVLDDGFQHLRLQRDLDIVCLDAADLRDKPFPGGRLRESPTAIGRAHMVVLTRLEEATPAEIAELENRLGPERTFRVRRRLVGVFAPDGRHVPPPDRPFLLAAIARPDRFEADARTLCSGVAGRKFSRDHHRWSDRELAKVAATAAAAGAGAILTTAKDAVRLPARLVPEDGGPGLPVLVLRMTLDVEDEPRFRARLMAAARKG
jgi:tetraacyldisaccharide 4'-kinase